MTLPPRKMRKSDLIAHLVEHFGIRRADAREILAELEQVIIRELRRTGEFTMPGIVKLKLYQRRARRGWDPRTGEPIVVPPRTAVSATFLQKFKAAVRDWKLPTDR